MLIPSVGFWHPYYDTCGDPSNITAVNGGGLDRSGGHPVYERHKTLDLHLSSNRQIGFATLVDDMNNPSGSWTCLADFVTAVR